MNIKINEELSNYILDNISYQSFQVGSKLYETNDENSDSDYLIIYDNFHKHIDLYYPNYHQFQYDNVEDNIQLIFTSKEQFYKNLFSGDSTINADVILFTDFDNWNVQEKLNILRTFNIIKAFIGFAKRDIKHYLKGLVKKDNKLFHIKRGLYCAECLLNNKLPTINDIKSLKSSVIDISELQAKEELLREKCNELFNFNELTMFPKNSIVKPINELEKLLIESNNIKEFKY